ncbi:hypothetical protein RB600_009106 [Gaeumannomyces tritici]
MVKVQPPKAPLGVPADYHVPCDIVLVIDVSGSISSAAVPPVKKGEAGEDYGFNTLDLVKHAALTILATLDERDRLGIVKFSRNAKVVMELLPMVEENKKLAKTKFLKLAPTLDTVMWNGIAAGFGVFERKQDGSNKVFAIMFIINGVPTSTPSSGWFGMSKNLYFKHSGKAEQLEGYFPADQTVAVELSYKTLGGERSTLKLDRDPFRANDPPEAEVAYHVSRLMLCKFLLSLFPYPASGKRQRHGWGEAKTRYEDRTPIDLKLAARLCGVKRAMLAPLFAACRARLNRAFDAVKLLPPNRVPPPPYRSSSIGNGERRMYSISNAYLNSNAPCFAGATRVRLAETATTVAIRDFARGMRVHTPLRPRAVAAVLRTRVRRAAVRRVSGVVVTL